MTKTALIIFSFIYGLAINGLTLAAENHHAHVHGVADLTVAYDKQVLEVQFESPAISILGFEHRPNSSEQEQLIANTKALLNSPEEVLSIDGASCSPSTVEVNITGPASQPVKQQKKKEDHDSHEEDHDSHEENYDSHEDEHHEHHKQSSTHSEVSALYVFDCSAKHAQSVTTFFFKHFSGLEKINVSWLTETQQGQSVLNATSSTVILK